MTKIYNGGWIVGYNTVSDTTAKLPHTKPQKKSATVKKSTPAKPKKTVKEAIDMLKPLVNPPKNAKKQNEKGVIQKISTKPSVKSKTKPAVKPSKQVKPQVKQTKPQKLPSKPQTKQSKLDIFDKTRPTDVGKSGVTNPELIAPLPRAPKSRPPKPKNTNYNGFDFTKVEGDLVKEGGTPLYPMTVKEAMRMQHEAYHQEGQAYKRSTDYRRILSADMYINRNGKWYHTYAPQNVGKFRRKTVYFEKVFGSGYRKGYRFNPISAKEAKEVGIYIPPAIMDVKVAVKEMNTLRKLVSKNRRITKKYDR